ncbi:MAG TPA: hypothetical protein VFR97_04670 [Capillimicrobium sp.]|nr:hypothetical protein [Capillimicrobium sp.]
MAVLLTVAAIVVGYARTALLDADQFADRATAALREQPVRDLVARKITDKAVLRANRDLVSVRPLIESAAGAIIGTSAFEGLFHAAVRDLHRTAFTRDRNTATLTLVDVGVLVSGALRTIDRKVARDLPAFDVKLRPGDVGLDAIDTAQIADRISSVALLLAIAAPALLLAGVLVAPRRRRAIVHAGTGVAIGGAALLIAYQVARGRVLAAFPVPEDEAAASEVWDAFLQDLRTWALVTLACGTIVAAAAASLLHPIEVERPLARARRLVTTVPARPAARALRAIALIAAGVLIIAQRALLLDAALILAGVWVLYQGVLELLRMLEREAEPAPAAEPAPSGRPHRPPRRVRALVAGGVAASLIALLVGGLVASGGTDAAADPRIAACNGSAALCDRPLDEVVFPATHNAMSAVTNENWLFPQQERDLAGQLDDGVRALLIDAHYGERVGSHVRTVLEGTTREELVEELGEPAVEAGERIRDRLLGSGEAQPRTEWLCHGFCELGAVELTAGLRQVRDFLVANPDEVLVIVIQDEGVTPADVAGAFDRSGLRPFVYTGSAGPSWPTLREMIESGGRVVVMAEHEGGGDEVPWYHAAYEGLVQETPYRFTKPSQLTGHLKRTCAPNRGGTEGAFFLLNHWVDTSPAPRPSNAAKVNAYDVLLRRARTCEGQRGVVPNLIAVDFYDTGDVFRVVDTLNETAASR